jgi:hypothetical protein
MPVLKKTEITEIKKAMGNMLTPLNQTVAKLYLASDSSGWKDTQIWGSNIVVSVLSSDYKTHFQVQ